MGFFLNIFVLLALAFQGLVPAGFMPGKSTGDEGLFPLVICTGTGEKTVYVGRDQAPEAPAHSEEKHTPCSYAPVLAQDTIRPLLLSLPPLTNARLSSLPAETIFYSFENAFQSRGPPRS